MSLFMSLCAFVSSVLHLQTLVKVDCDDPLYGQPQRVAMRAGSMVIWDQRMAHGSAPNDSCNPR